MRFSVEFRGLHVSAFSIRPLMRIPKSVSLVLAPPGKGREIGKARPLRESPLDSCAGLGKSVVLRTQDFRFPNRPIKPALQGGFFGFCGLLH
jgi:hypothetical protein